MDNDDRLKLEKGCAERETDHRSLQSKLRETELQKIELEREVKVLREKNEDLERRIASIEKGTEVHSEFEGRNNVCQCEKHNAEREEVEHLKQKCKELESQLFLLQGSSGFGGKQIASIREAEHLDDIVNMLAAANNVIPDEGCEGNKGLDVVTPFPSAEGVPFTNASMIEPQGNEDSMSDCSEKFPFVVTARSKRLQNVVTSDDESADDVKEKRGKRSENVVSNDNESDDDDNMPIGQLVRKRVQGRAISECEALSDSSPRKRRRLVKLGQNKTDGLDNEDEDDEDDEDDDDSLGNFIDSSSDSEQDLVLNEEEDPDDSSDDLDDILHKIRRTKDDGSKWELEGDMLSALGKDPLLCMKAVCAIYRREPQFDLGNDWTYVADGRGFNKYDARSGAILASFLTGGDPDGGVVKSVEELNEYYPNGAEQCEKLAKRYSKQLFEIYQNAEDPYFFPPPH